MGLFNNRGGAIADVIRCDEPDYLIWKWHPTGSESRNSKRENAIRWGSSLRVKEGSVAVFVYKQKNGAMQDYVEGPFDEMLSTKNLPILSSIIGLAYDGNSPFQAEVYFINLAKINQSKFAIPYFDVYDPRFQDFGVPIAVRGTMTFQIKDYREFIKLHRLEEFSHETFDKQLKDALSKYVKAVVSNAPEKNNMPVIQIERQIQQINELVVSDIQERLSNEFGVLVSSIDIASLDIDKSSDGYYQLMAVTKNVTEAKIQAETKDYIERLRIQREEGQYAVHKATQSTNIGAYQVEKRAEVGIAGANALGQMGSNGAGTVDLGGGNSGAGFNPAAMMAGMAVGSAVGNNIAGTLQNAMSGINQPLNSTTPPPIPEVVYNVALNGQPTGPYSISVLAQMAQANQINAETLVWKPGMTSWTAIKSIDELSTVLNAIPPILPIG